MFFVITYCKKISSLYNEKITLKNNLNYLHSFITRLFQYNMKSQGVNLSSFLVVFEGMKVLILFKESSLIKGWEIKGNYNISFKVPQNSLIINVIIIIKFYD